MRSTAVGWVVVTPIFIFGIPVDFILFGLTLLGVAVFHHRTLEIALTGLAVITLYKLAFTGFKFGAGLGGLAQHIHYEWVNLANLFLLSMGFALLSRHFETSEIPGRDACVPARRLERRVRAACCYIVLSVFLDNIAGALIGGTMARHVFRWQGSHRLPGGDCGGATLEVLGASWAIPPPP